MSKNRDSLYDKTQETISPRALKALQLQKLKKVVRFAAQRSDLYKNKKGLIAASARFASLADFAQAIPFTTKQDLIECGTYGNLCVPQEDIAEVHCSSGTSNKPVFSFLTRKDLRESSAYLARTWHMQGASKGGTCTMFASYGLFSAGLLNHYAIQRAGAFVIPAGNASALKSFEMLKEFGADSCVAVASYYLYLIAMAEANNIDLTDIKLKYMVAGGEPFSEKQRAYVEKTFHATLYNQYGLCEINTGIAGECSEKNGLHILADYVYPEIIDPNTGAVLKDGEEGELVLTTFHKEASPLLRYRTGDITNITYAPCPCGRTMPRIVRIQRRVIDTLFYKGMKIEKPHVAQMLEAMEEYIDPYLWQMEIVSGSSSEKDALVLKIKAKHDEEKARNHLTGHIQKKLGVSVTVRAFTEQEVSHLANGKFKNFIDNRRV